MKANIKHYRPSPGYILVKPLQKTTGNIEYVTDEVPQHAEVISVGDTAKNIYTDRDIEPPCKVGQQIIHSGAGFENLKIDGEEYRIVNFSKVLMVKK